MQWLFLVLDFVGFRARSSEGDFQYMATRRQIVIRIGVILAAIVAALYVLMTLNTMMLSGPTREKPPPTGPR
jgi:hypothetical protein